VGVVRPGARRFRRSADPAEPRGASQPEQAQEVNDTRQGDDTGQPPDRLNELGAPGVPAWPGANGQPAEPMTETPAAPAPAEDSPEDSTAGEELASAPVGKPASDSDSGSASTVREEPASAPVGKPASDSDSGSSSTAGEEPASAPVGKPASALKGRAVRLAHPGRAWVRPTRGRRARARPGRPRSDASGKAFSRLTVLPAVLVIAWLLPGVPLLLGGAFSLAPMLVISIPLAAAIIVIGLRQVPGRWPLSAQAGPGRDGGRPPWWALIGTLAVAVGFAAWQIVMNSQQLIVTRDQGIYLQFGYWLSQHGSASIPASAAAFGGPHPGLLFGSLGFIQQGATLVPQFLAGLPIVLAAGVWAGGAGGALLIPPLLGGLAVLAFGGLVGRLAGPRWAPAGALVLALALPEQYVSRSTFSEPLVQILLFGGLCLVIDSLCSPARRTAGPDSRAALGRGDAFDIGGGAGDDDAQTSPLDAYPGYAGGLDRAAEQTRPLPLDAEPGAPAGRPRRAARWWRDLNAGWRARLGQQRWAGPSQATMLAALGGLALGLTTVVRVDALNALLPVIPLIGILFAARKPQWLPLSLGTAAGVGYGLAAGYVLARPYLDSLASWTRAFGIIAAGVALVTLDVALVMRFAAPRRLVRRGLAAPPLRWLPEAVAALTVVAVIAFAVRPYVQTVRGDTNKSMISYVGYLQRLAGLPLDPRRLYAEDTLYWVIWYIGVPAVLLGTFGMAILGRRVVRSLATWHDPGGGARVWGLVLLTIGWVAVTVLWRPAVAPDQPWASRRLVTVVLPGLILVAVWTAAWLTSQARQRGASPLASAAVAAFCVGALLLPTALTTFGVGVTRSGSTTATPSSAGLALKQTSAGELSAVNRLCAAIGPSASVVILDQRTGDRFTQLIRGICDTPTARMIRPSPSAVQNVIAGILRARRHPVLIGGYRAELEGYGATPRQVLNLTTTQDAHELAQPPKTTWRVRYVVWMVTPSYG
jgi:hypothetical protein